MQKIIGFAGKMQSGKSSAAKFICGNRLQTVGMIEKFSIDEKGDLYIPVLMQDNNGVKSTGMGLLDLNRRDYEFMAFAAEKVWPHCKTYGFATLLKESVIEIFGIDPQYVYGSNDDKNKEIPVTSYKDSNILTGRTILQEFGSICRKMKQSCWVDGCIRQIVNEDYEYCLIDDVRHINEVDAIHKLGGKVIYLTLSLFDSGHSSEQELKPENCDYTIDNQNMTLDQKHQELTNILGQLGWLQGQVS